MGFELSVLICINNHCIIVLRMIMLMTYVVNESRHKRKHEGVDCFLDMEAEVSQESSASEDEDENLDGYLPGFIDNATQPSMATQMTPGCVQLRHSPVAI